MRGVLAFAIATSLLGVSCKQKESLGQVIHQTVDEARTRPRVQIDIMTEKQDPSPAELQTQQSIEKQIEKEHFARIVDDGSGPGYVRINVEFDKKPEIEKLRAILQAAGVVGRSSVKIVQQ